MKVNNTLVSAITATTFMTLFSHLVSEFEGENFGEPLLLSKLIHKLIPKVDNKTVKSAGWALHFGTGIAFTSIYKQYLTYKKQKPNVNNGLLMGGISGIAGIAMWKSVFSAHPFPPKLTYGKFYTQLFVAHLIFGALTGVTLKMLEEKHGPSTALPAEE